jgi:tRNA threonylcarbamoyladenosine modification (KEOPS) complex Cgi121 subunit
MITDEMDPNQIKSDLIKTDDDIAIFDAKNIICENQIYSSIHRAEKAKITNSMIAKTWGFELILQLSAQHQVKRALILFQVNSETRCIIIISPNSDLKHDKLIYGLPKIDPTETSFITMDLVNTDNPCKEIISRGVRMVLDHE